MDIEHLHLTSARLLFEVVLSLEKREMRALPLERLVFELRLFSLSQKPLNVLLFVLINLLLLWMRGAYLGGKVNLLGLFERNIVHALHHHVKARSIHLHDVSKLHWR